MIEWLGVLAFCAAERCFFWATTEAPISSQDECKAKVEQAAEYFSARGAAVITATCIPLRWVRS